MKFEAIRATIEDAPIMGHIHSESWKKAYRGIIQDDIVDSFTSEKRTEVFKEAKSTRPEEMLCI